MTYIPVADRLGETKEYYFSKKLREITRMNQEGEPVLNLGIGSPDLPPHPSVVETLYEEARKSGAHGYQSYKGAPQLRKAFAVWYEKYFSVALDPEKEIMPLIGSKEGIMHISMTFLNPGDEVLVPDPGYPTYTSASHLAGAVCVPYDLEEELNWQPDLKKLEEKDLSKVKIMWVNYPQMPTGGTADPHFFERLVKFAARNGILLCHDNPYSFILPADLKSAPRPLSLLSIPGAKEVALELNSLSKSHNMAGWRVGMLAGREEMVQEVLRFKSNMDSGMFLPLQLAAATALSLGDDWYRSVNEVYKRREDAVKELLRLLDCTFQEQQQGLFVWAKVSSRYQDGYELSDRVLYGARVFITPGGIFGKNGNNFVRVSLCQPEEVIRKAIKKVKAIL